MSRSTDETFPQERSGHVGQIVEAKGPGWRGCGLGLCHPIGGLLGKKSYRRQASLDVRPGDDVVRIEAVVAGSSLRRPGSVRRVDRSRDR
jgi:hypothetical protein